MGVCVCVCAAFTLIPIEFNEQERFYINHQQQHTAKSALCARLCAREKERGESSCRACRASAVLQSSQARSLVPNLLGMSTVVEYTNRSREVEVIGNKNKMK